MEKMQSMFMKELKDMHENYSVSQAALEDLQSKLGKDFTSDKKHWSPAFSVIFLSHEILCLCGDWALPTLTHCHPPQGIILDQQASYITPKRNQCG